MTKSLLISIQPQHLLNILNGDKTYEVRKVVPKWVLEKLDRGETVEAYLYCTKGKPELLNIGDGTYKLSQCNCNAYNQLNGTISVKVVIDGYKTIVSTPSKDSYCSHDRRIEIPFNLLLDRMCLSHQQLIDYGQGKDLYALNISKVEILDEVMGLDDFVTWDEKRWYTDENRWMTHWKTVTKAPQNCMSVWVK